MGFHEKYARAGQACIGIIRLAKRVIFVEACPVLHRFVQGLLKPLRLAQ
jgi:hypothetical protein